MTFMFAAFIVVAVGLFVLGYLFIPKGYLTKAVSSVALAFTTIHEFLSEQWHLLSELVPPEYGGWVIGGFLFMAILAIMRKA